MPPQQHKAKILEVRQETPHIKVFKLKLNHEFSFKPGQFFILFLKDDDGEFTRAYSIASSPLDKDFIELCIKIEKKGRASQVVDKWKVKDTFQVIGPVGEFNLKNGKDELVFIAVGVGIAPIMSMIRTLMKEGTKHKIKLIFGFRNKEDFVYKKEIKEYEKNDNFELVEVISSLQVNDEGERMHVQDVLKDHVKDAESTEFYLCGFKNMVEKVREKLLELNTPKDLIFSERF